MKDISQNVKTVFIKTVSQYLSSRSSVKAEATSSLLSIFPSLVTGSQWSRVAMRRLRVYTSQPPLQTKVATLLGLSQWDVGQSVGKICRKVPERKLSQLASPFCPVFLLPQNSTALENGCDGSSSCNYFVSWGNAEENRTREEAWIPDDFTVLWTTRL